MEGNKILMNKRGQVESALYFVVALFVLAITVFFVVHLSTDIFGGFDDYFEDSDDYVNTTAHETLQEIDDVQNSEIWDYGILAIFIGLIIQMIVLSYLTRISPVFFWIFVFMALLILMVGVVLSATWQELSTNPEFSDTITLFPITNLLLGSYFPIIVTAMIFILLIVLFGKPPSEVI